MIFCLVLPVLVSCGDGPKRVENNFIYKVNVDDTVTVVGWSGLENELVIPDEIDGKRVTVIGGNAFRAVKGLVSVTIPDTVTAIDYAFVDCKELERVTLGKGIVTMNGAFSGCSALESVTLHEGIAEMSEAFKDCTSLTAATVPASVTYCISAYRGCTSITEAVVENGVASLDYVFEGCTSLVSANVPESVKSAVSAFDGCSSLESVEGCASLEALDCTFRDCSSLKTLSLGNGIRVMKEAFVNCASLESISGLPRSVEEDSYSFTGCASLEGAVIPERSDEVGGTKYDITEDVKGCVSLKKLEILTDFMVQGEFCKTFAGLSSLEEMTLTDDVFLKLLRVSYYYEDRLYDGNDSKVSNQVASSKKASTVRITDDYGYIDGQSYTHVYGYDLYVFDADSLAESTEVLGFEGFTKVSYWCGYPKHANRKNTTVGIERTYTYHLRVTGKNDGTLPPEIIINGIPCMTDVMQA